VTQLRKQMLEELQRRNYSQTTVKGYLKIVEAFIVLPISSDPSRFARPRRAAEPETAWRYCASTGCA
jgi:hypothetical protein